MGQSGASSAEADREKDAVKRDVRSISFVIGAGLGLGLGDGGAFEALVVSFAPNLCFRELPGGLGTGTVGKAESTTAGDPSGVGLPVLG